MHIQSAVDEWTSANDIRGRVHDSVHQWKFIWFNHCCYIVNAISLEPSISHEQINYIQIYKIFLHSYPSVIRNKQNKKMSETVRNKWKVIHEFHISFNEVKMLYPRFNNHNNRNRFDNRKKNNKIILCWMCASHRTQFSLNQNHTASSRKGKKNIEVCTMMRVCISKWRQRH